MHKSKTSQLRIWISFLIQAVIVLLLAIGALSNIFKTKTAVTNAKMLGYEEATLLPLAVFLLACLILYLIPRTAIVGALLLTAWFGGASATHIIHGDSFPVLLLPVIFCMLVWIAIGIRNRKVQSIFQ